MFTLKIKTDNAAFGDDPALEVARILRRLAADVGYGETKGLLFDANGNSVGTFRLTLAKERR